MKDTGMIRNIDPLGRVVIPKELRKNLGIEKCDPIEIFTDGSKIVLQKHQTGCIFCGEITENVFKGKYVCSACAKAVSR